MTPTPDDGMPSADRQGVEDLLARFDAAFRADDGRALGDLFAADARLQWPEMEDIVGREEIRSAFVELTEAFHTISWDPSYQVFDVHHDHAYLLGRFIETRRDVATGVFGYVPGRLFYRCHRQADRAWRFTHLMTSRYAEEQLEQPHER